MIGTNWISRDYGKNDNNPNCWTRQYELEENYLDWAESRYDGLSRYLTKLDYKFEYLWGPPIDKKGLKQYGDPKGNLVSVRGVDPPLGPQTEAFFDEVVENLQTLPQGEPMEWDDSPLCDFDHDGDCDPEDFEFFQHILGTCINDDNYNPIADIDGSGCIDSDDEYFLFEQDTDNDGITDLADNCPADENIDQLDLDGDGIGYICDDEIQVPVDIKPQSCPNPLNTNSKGVLPVAILGTVTFNINQINPASIRLEGVPPLRYAEEDVATPYLPFTNKNASTDCTEEGPDGNIDLTLKFNTQDIVNALDPVEDGEVRILKLTGNLIDDDKPIIGEDVIVILKKK
jgi:hypothetical protein